MELHGDLLLLFFRMTIYYLISLLFGKQSMLFLFIEILFICHFGANSLVTAHSFYKKTTKMFWAKEPASYRSFCLFCGHFIVPTDREETFARKAYLGLFDHLI